MTTHFTIPVDDRNNAVQILQGRAALAVNRYTAGGIDTAQDITLNARIRLLRIVAIDYPVLLRLQASASTSNFDYAIPAGGVLDLGIRAGMIPTISIIADTANARAIVTQY